MTDEPSCYRKLKSEFDKINLNNGDCEAARNSNELQNDHRQSLLIFFNLVNQTYIKGYL